MQALDDLAGTNDGYFAKCLHADAPSGRQAGWEILELFADALFRYGCNIIAVPQRTGVAHLPKPANDSAPVQLALDLETCGQHCTLTRWHRKRSAPRGYRVRPRRRAAAA